LDDKAAQQTAFEAHVSATIDRLTPAEQRMARFFVDQKQAVLLGSAAQIADMAGASDATVVRTAKSLGFDTLSALREVLLSDLTGSPSPGARLERTLEEAGARAGATLGHVVTLHEQVLAVLKRPDVASSFEQAVDILAGAGRRHIFGIGPSGAMAEYATLQFNRIGLPTNAMSVSGIGLADRLMAMQAGDAVLMMAYAPLYREVTVVLDESERLGIPVVLVSDNLGPIVAGQVAAVLPIPRGKADHLAMHGGTAVLIEALIIGLAGRSRDTAIGSLDRLSSLRGALDKSWSKRGVKKSKETK